MSTNPQFQDHTLTCTDCGSQFIFSAGQQAFFREKGYSEPKQCSFCRQLKKQRRADEDKKRGGHR